MSVLTAAPGKLAMLYRGSGQARWSLASQAVTSGANFVLMLLLLRAIGVEQFGRYSLSYLIALNLSGVLQALIALPAVSIGALETGTVRTDVVGRATALYLLYGSAAFASMCLIDWSLGAFWVRPDVSVTLAGAFFVSLALAEYIRRVLFLLENVRLAFTFDVLRYGLTFFGCWYTFAVTQAKIAEAFVTAVLGAHLAAVALTVALRQVASSIRPRWHDMASFQARIWRSGGWLSGTSILQFCNEHLFVVVGFAFLGPHTIGLVRAGQTLVGLVNPILYSLENVIPLQIGQRLAQEGKASAMRFFRRQATAIAAALALLLLTTAIVAQPLLDLVVGPEASDSAWILQALCLMEFFLVLRVLLTFPLRAMENTRPVFVAILMTAVCSSGLAVPMIALHGVVGMLLCLVLAQALGFVTLSYNYAVWRR